MDLVTMVDVRSRSAILETEKRVTILCTDAD